MASHLDPIPHAASPQRHVISFTVFTIQIVASNELISASLARLMTK